MGKSKRKGRKLEAHTTRLDRHGVGGREVLIGFSWKVVHKKLRPLRRSRSDKLRDATILQEYEERCNHLERLLVSHQNLLERIHEVAAEEGHDGDFLQELQHMRANNVKHIRFLLKTNVAALPRKLLGKLNVVTQKDKALKDVKFLLQNLEKKSAQPEIDKSHRNVNCSGGRQGRKSETLQYQLFIHGVDEKAPLVVKLKASDTGSVLERTIKEKFKKSPTAKYSFIYHGKKILSEHTLKEQGLQNDSNIQLHFGLRGGMDQDDTHPISSAVKTQGNPVKWKKAQLATWIDQMCEEYELEKEGVVRLKELSGPAINLLKRRDWIDRSPGQGDVLYNLWIDMVPPRQTKETSEHEKENVAEAPVSTPKPEVEDDSIKEDVRAVVIHENQAVSEESSGDRKGPFGAVEKLDDVDSFLSIDDLSKSPPQPGAIVSVTGFCSSRPHVAGNAGTVLLRNDPPPRKTFLELKVDVRVCPDSKLLTKHNLSTALDQKLGKPFFIRGRVECLDKKIVSMKKGFELLPFKVVVDSDTHAVAREEVKVERPFARQFSTPWHVEMGIFPAEGSSHEPLFQKDILTKTPEVLWCLSDDTEKILEMAVALKNSMPGDIYIGVTDDGRLEGMKLSKDQVMKKREKLVRDIGGILPSVNDEVSVCTSASNAQELVDKKKAFVAAMWLPREEANLDGLKEEELFTTLFRIHVVKGSHPLHFIKEKDSHAYVRVGAETKPMNDYEDLFSRLESLASRKIPEKKASDIEQEVQRASTYRKSEQTYNLFKKLRFETDRREFKVIYGDPKSIILERYVNKYSASFLNTDGGDIYFGVEEDRKFKVGHVVGVVLSQDERKELLKETSRLICNFWPPVDSTQFLMKFSDVKCNSSRNLLTYPKTHLDHQGEPIVISVKSCGQIEKVRHFVDSVTSPASLVRIKENQFCILVDDVSRKNEEEIVSKLEKESQASKKFALESQPKKKVDELLKDLCVVCLHVNASPYPIHLTHFVRSFCLDGEGNVRKMTPQHLLQRFSSRKTQFEVDKFLQAVNDFDNSSTSYVMVTSPFCLPKTQRDLYGLVIPEWSLVLDFDQNPNGEGHLLSAFRPKHDVHQVERNFVVNTPVDRKLSLNPSNGVCWCAVRGYEDIDETLSKEGHAKWMKTHWHNVKKLLSELVNQVQPNQLVVQVLWNDGHEELLRSLNFVLETMFSLYDPVKVVFVCSNARAESAIARSVVVPLKKAGYGVKEGNVFVSLPNHLALDLGAKLPAPYRPENAFQIPKKLYLPDGDSRTIPDTLPQNLRQAVKGHLEIMYLNTGAQAKPQDVEKAREEFYAGSEISPIGLSNGIGIERHVMKKLKKEIKSMLSDRRSHVSIMVLKAERGAGGTTLGLQLLYEYHKQFICARLLEFHDDLVVNIEKIAHSSNLPFILFVDSEMANLPEFIDFKNEAEKRSVKLLMLVVESDVYVSKTSKKRGEAKGLFMLYSTGMTPYESVELNRELTTEEVSCLMQQLVKIKATSDDKRERLRQWEGRAKSDGSLRKFAYFSLTLFGKKFTGLMNYVAFRLNQANEDQMQVLEFLSLTHVYTGCQFPVNALARCLDIVPVNLERVFNKEDVRELLSPPSLGKGVRRVSFLEVAEEILKQQAKKREMEYVNYLKDVAVRLARVALSVSCPSKAIDRITRRLYVTSEYGSEKFSPLVRCMRDLDETVACEMLKELCDTFEKGSSVWAHLLAHLAKYYMRMDTPNFNEAIPLIKEALREHKDDVLLHHIHGDIIRVHIKNLKDEENFDMEEILKFAIQSSECFEVVRQMQPLMESGYTSDALVRKIVMLAAIKFKGVQFYVDYLDAFLQEIGPNNQRQLTPTDKLILCLVPDAFAFLREVPISEHTAILKETLLTSTGDLDKLKKFCENLEQIMKGSCNEGWVEESVLHTTSLIYALEVERRQLTEEEADERIKKLEELLTLTDHDDESMKLWIRCVRLGSTTPNLKTVRKRVTKWLKATRRKSANALFYNYVVAILEAISDANDTEKMKVAGDAIDEMRRKRQYKQKQVSEDPALPIEWLHPKQERHINSIDSLLYHEDLVQNYFKKDARPNRVPRGAGREIIERALFEKNICKWDGIVSEVLSDWKGIICFKRRISVPFVPNNVPHGMPCPGEKVRFCIAFHWSGPRAYYVVSEPGVEKLRKAVSRPFVDLSKAESDSDDDERNEDGRDKDDAEKGLVPMVQPLHRRDIKPRQRFEQREDMKGWDLYDGRKMQGLVSQTYPEGGFGFIRHPDVEDELFFHAQQMVPPVESLKVTKNLQTVVSFTVGKAGKGPRAVNIEIVEEPDILPDVKDYRDSCQSDDKSSLGSDQEAPKTMARLKERSARHEGRVVQVNRDSRGLLCGYIKISTVDQPLYFHEQSLDIPRKEAKKIKRGTKVQFTIDYDPNSKVEVAKNIFIQCQETASSCDCGWEEFVNDGQFRNGFLFLKKSNFGFISKTYPASSPRGLYVHNSKLMNCTFDMLETGHEVSFKVTKNERSCNATEVWSIPILRQQQQGSLPNAVAMHSVPMLHPVCMLQHMPQPSPPVFSGRGISFSPGEPNNDSPGSAEAWQTVKHNKRKR